jgi:hypothetical protein
MLRELAAVAEAALKRTRPAAAMKEILLMIRDPGVMFVQLPMCRLMGANMGRAA